MYTEESCATIECATQGLSGSSSSSVEVETPSIDVKGSESERLSLNSKQVIGYMSVLSVFMGK